MSLFISSLNSGSNGNCYYIGNDKEAILVDAGISCREIEIRMLRLGLNMERVRAIFVSHEHKDHITGLRITANKYQLPVYITEGTQKIGKISVERHLLKRFSCGEVIRVGDLLITPFQKYHDAGDPHSFTINYNGIQVGVFTDIGRVCEKLSYYFSQCHAAFLEANYDEEMLMNGGYPWYLKKRITGGNGHLSNVQALALLKANRPPVLTHLILSHLSRNNNDPDLVRALFEPHAMTTQIIIASRFQETPLYSISSSRGLTKPQPSFSRPLKKQQLSLFPELL
jgi:phosphoribosyl 1,2-cyclic phosphodiesterase